jgi:hypothetical protein
MPLRRREGLASCLVVLAVFLLLPSAVAAGGCSAPSNWFTGVPDVPNFTPATTCQFQQWSWQTLLALLATGPTQPVARYFTWDLPKPDMYDLYCQSVCQTTASMPKNPCPGGDPNQEVLTATDQPGYLGAKSSGTLIDQARNKVYITSHINGNWLQFVTDQKLYDPLALLSANPRSAFPAGVFEIKTSWRLADGLSPAERANYYITNACIALNPPATQQAEVALVGFHVTGGTTDHPELIWATFEHVSNAPDCDETPIAASPIGGPWSFYDGKAHCRTHPELCNQPNSSSIMPPPPINVCRKYPFGGADLAVALQIDQLNRDVHARLPLGSVLQFYDLVGSLWAKDPQPMGIPTLNLQAPAGSPQLSNTTLETFKQNVSCFGCHNPQFPGELAGDLGPHNPFRAVTVVDKSLFASHVVLLPLFFAADSCQNVCGPRPGHAVNTGNQRE